MNRGEIYRTHEKVPERGCKAGYYVIVSRTFIAQNEDVSTVVCAPIYGEVLGLRSEVVLGPEEGLPYRSSIRCDCVMLMFKRKLTRFVGALSRAKEEELNRALRYALEIPS